MADCFENFYDIIIIGGGATGSGIALDASLRGYKTLLVEKNDFASGTSSKSTKLIHGGVRYLEKAITHVDNSQYNLVKEALEERSYFLSNAPHLSKPITLLTPIYKWFEIPYIYAGLYLYDFISDDKSIGDSAFVFKDKILSSHPAIKYNDLCGGVKYYDGSFNDARMVIALLQTAQSLGAVVKNYHKVDNLMYENNTLSGVYIKDVINNKKYRVKTACIINATGVYVDEIRKLDDYKTKNILEMSSGIHIVVDKQYLNIEEAILIPKTKDDRVIFIIPWQGHCLIGTTDNKETSLENIRVMDEEINYLLDETNQYFDTKIEKSDILSSWKGLRPLIKKEDNNSTSSIVREHHIYKSKSNLITIAGGKWTTYRKMAENVLDFAIENDILDYKKECETKNYKVIGSQKHIEKSCVPEIANEQWNILFQLYGDKIQNVLKIAKEENAFEVINKEFFYIKAQIIYSVRFEYVKKPLDFLLRRTPLLLLNKAEALKSVEYITKVISKLLSWSNTQYLKELYHVKLCINENRF